MDDSYIYILLVSFQHKYEVRVKTLTFFRIIKGIVYDYFDWRNGHKMSTMYIKSCKLIDFNFRFLHRSLTSDSDLRKIGIREDRKCTLHYKEKDLMHLFWQYEKRKCFGRIFRYGCIRFKYFQQTTIYTLTLLQEWSVKPPISDLKSTWVNIKF